MNVGSRDAVNSIANGVSNALSSGGNVGGVSISGSAVGSTAPT